MAKKRDWKVLLRRAGLARRVSSRLSGKERHFYGSRVNKISKYDNATRDLMSLSEMVQGGDVLNQGGKGIASYNSVGDLGGETCLASRVRSKFSGKGRTFYGSSKKEISFGTKKATNLSDEKDYFSPILPSSKIVKTVDLLHMGLEEVEQGNGLASYKNVVDLGGKSGPERRTSSRLLGQKRPFYGSSTKKILFETKFDETRIVNIKGNSIKLREEVGAFPTALHFSGSVDGNNLFNHGGQEVEGGEGAAGNNNAGDLGVKSCPVRANGTSPTSLPFSEVIDNMLNPGGQESEREKEVAGYNNEGDLGGESCLLRRVSSRLSCKRRPFYGSSVRKMYLSEDEGTFPVSLPYGEVISGGNTLSQGGQEFGGGEGAANLNNASDPQGKISSVKKVSSRLSGKKRPFYGLSKEKTVSGGKPEEVSINKVAKFDRCKRVLMNYREGGTSPVVFPSKDTVQVQVSDQLHQEGEGFKGREHTTGCNSIDDLGRKACSGRKISLRLSSIKRPFYGSSTKKISSDTKNKNTSSKKTYELDATKALNLKEHVKCTREVLPSSEKDGAGDLLTRGKKEVHSGQGVVSYNPAGDFGVKDAHQRVKRTIRLFNKYYLQLVQEKEKWRKKVEKGKDVKDARKEAESMKKGNPYSGGDANRPEMRPELKAMSKMIEGNRILYRTKVFGNLSGIDVGHRFYSRAEMVVVGFHGHWLKGIDYMSAATYNKREEYKSYEFPLAVSVVISGMYEDDLDNLEDVVFTGEGGNNLKGNMRQVEDQKMTKGNLALTKNLEQNMPVRVTRGHKSAGSSKRKMYIYDGLYRVVSCWDEKGVSGFTVFKYRLRRIEGQPPLTTNQVHHARVPTSLSELRGKVCNDISGHKENIPVPASNLVDHPPVAPMGYKYCKSIQLGKGVKLPVSEAGCSCKGTCVDPGKCACAKLNGSDFPYVGRDVGRLVEAKSVVFECGPNCKCGPGCVNRTSQRGLRYRLEVFRTPNKGWAVRSWDFIPSGAPVCEYIGKITRTTDLDNVSGNEFIFQIDCLETMEGLDGRESRAGVVSLPTTASLKRKMNMKQEPEFCIDAGKVGAVARFINHSCEPNLFVQCVLSSHHDIRLARIVLFAADNIPSMQELSYDYGVALDSVMGPDGKIKVMPCYCGAKDCRKRLY